MITIRNTKTSSDRRHSLQTDRSATFRSYRQKIGASLVFFGVSAFCQETTFSEHVAPIIYENCIVCHRPDGSAPFSLQSYAEARKRSQQIAEVVEDRYMPPWKASPQHGPSMIGERSLSQEEIDTILAWANLGAPEGDSALAPKLPHFEGSWTHGVPDLIIELKEDYTLPPEGTDVYRNFVIPTQSSTARWVTAFEFLSGSQSAIHHAVMQFDTSDWSRKKDSESPGPGFDGMELTNASNPQGQFVGWAPGQIVYESYPGTAWQLPAKADLILQLHMLPTGKPETIRPKIGLYFSDQPPTRQTTFIQLRELDIDIPAGTAKHLVSEKITLPVATQIIGVYPHAHYIAKDIQLFATLPDGTTQWLLLIPDWDFNWQTEYRYVEPVKLPAGSKLEMQIVYDNSDSNIRNPSSPPQRVGLGWNSTDEMGEAIFQVLLEDESELPLLQKAANEYEMNQLGGPANYYYTLGVDMEEMGRFQDAETAYQRALESDSRLAKAHNNLGALFEEKGDISKAIGHYRSALRSKPDLSVASLNLSRVYEKSGQTNDAIAVLSKSTQVAPRDDQAWLELSRLFVESENFRKATGTLATALAWHPKSSQVNLQIGKLYAMQGDFINAEIHLESALELGEQTPEVTDSERSDAFYTLAIISNERRNFDQALQYAQRATELDPHDLEPKLLAASLAISLGNRNLSRSLIGQVLDAESTKGIQISDIASVLPFPEGIKELSIILYQRGQVSQSKKLLQEALQFARNQGRSDWIQVLESAQ